MRALFPLTLFCGISFGIASCETYHAPPDVELVGATNGILTDPSAPLDVFFTKPVDPATIDLRIVRFVTNPDGSLADDADQPPAPTVLYAHQPGQPDYQGTSTLSADGHTFSITLQTPPTIGQRFVLLVAKGLRSTDGYATGDERRIFFGYDFACAAMQSPTKMPGGDYFFLVDVDMPLPVQIRLFAHLDVDPMTGAMKGRFTDAVRNNDGSRCSPACKKTEACQTVPQMGCIPPSTRAGSTDEWVDYVPNDTPPMGFDFEVTGCAVDQPNGTTAFAIAPVDVVVQQPPVTVKGAVLSASFSADAAGVERGEGSLRSTDLLLGSNSAGAGSGSVQARIVDASRLPAPIPTP